MWAGTLSTRAEEGCLETMGATRAVLSSRAVSLDAARALSGMQWTARLRGKLFRIVHEIVKRKACFTAVKEAIRLEESVSQTALHYFIRNRKLDPKASKGQSQRRRHQP